METFDFKKRIYTVLLLGQISNSNEKKMFLWTGFAYRLEDAEQNAKQIAQQSNPGVNDWSLSIHTQVDIEKIIEEYKKQEKKQNDSKSTPEKILEAGYKVEYAKEEPSERSKLMSKIIKGGEKEFDKHRKELTIAEQRYLEIKMKIK